MKKIITVAALAITTLTNAQAIDKGNIVIQAGAGLTIYHHQFTDLNNNVVDDRDTSGSWSFPFQVEYGVTRWLGGGLAFTYNSFIVGDSTDNDKATVLDIVPTAHLHVPWGLKKFDLSASVGFGYSNFKYTIDEPTHPIAKANGTVLVIGANPRLYLGENARFGITAWYRYTKHMFKEGTVTDDTNQEYKFKLEGPGNGFGLGLVLKF